MRMWTIVLACLVFWVSGFATAKADATPPPQGWGAASLEVAYAYWGTDAPPLCTSETIHWDEDPPSWGGTRLAAATVPTSPVPCEMWVGPGLSVYNLCLIVVHEYSHWMGNGWSTDPHSVTYDGNLEHSSSVTIPWEPEIIQGCWKLSHNKWR